MKTIWKYSLLPTTGQNLSLPFGAEILSVKEQNENIVLYALVDPNEEGKTNRMVLIFGTGHEISNIKGFQFIDTVKLQGGALMFHVFIKE